MDKVLKEIIREDKDYYFGKGIKCIYRYITCNPLYQRGKYIIVCRKLSYFKKKSGLLYRVLSFIYQREKNILGQKLHLELGTNQFGRRLRIYHNNIVVNGGAIIGDDCELYGCNCIGNKGSKFDSLGAPTIGNHVSFGVGANAIGKINICDYVQISSMSLVNKDITQAGLYVGTPVKLFKHER